MCRGGTRIQRRSAVAPPLTRVHNAYLHLWLTVCGAWRSCNPRGPTGVSAATAATIGLAQHVSQMANAGMSLAGIRRILALEAEVAALRAQIATLQSVAAKG